MKKKKNKSKGPRRKRMKQPGRLASAKHWIQTYEGKNIVKGYSKWYGVSMLCAVRELKMIGIETDEDLLTLAHLKGMLYYTEWDCPEDCQYEEVDGKLIELDF